MAATEGLFSSSLIPSSVLSQLPPGYTIRPLAANDYNEGFIDVLRVLTTVGDISPEKWSERYEWMAKRNEEYFLIVVVDESRPAGSKVVGTGALIVEKKL
jgi:glucosamine-phosphate N-acetyltransferase